MFLDVYYKHGFWKIWSRTVRIQQLFKEVETDPEIGEDSVSSLYNHNLEIQDWEQDITDNYLGIEHILQRRTSHVPY